MQVLINSIPFATLMGVHIVALKGAHIELVDSDGVISIAPLPVGRSKLDVFQPLAEHFSVHVKNVVVVVSRQGAASVLPPALHFETAASQDYMPSDEYRRVREMAMLSKQIVGQIGKRLKRRARNEEVRVNAQTKRIKREERPKVIEDKREEKPSDDDEGGQ